MADEKLKVAGIKLRIDGAAEFSKTLKITNSDIKTSQAELKKTQAEYQEQGKTVEALSAKQKALQKVIDEQRSKTRQLNDILAETTKEYGENSTQVAAVRSQVAQSEAAQAQFEAQLKQTNDELYEQNNKLLQLGKRCDEIGSKITNAGEKINKVGNTLTIGVTTPIVATGAAAYKMSSDLTEAMNKADSTFGEKAKEIQEWSKQSLENVGMARSTALDAVSLYGDMATSMNLPIDQATEMSKKLVELSADLSSFKNVPIEQSQNALKGIFTGETESLKNLGIVMTETELSAYALATGIEKDYKELTQAEKVQLRYNFVLEKSANAIGDYAKTSDEAAGQMRKTPEALKELGATFGQEFAPMITKGIDKANDAIVAFGELDEGNKKAVVSLAAVAAATGPVISVGGKLVTSTGKIISGGSKLINKLAGIKKHSKETADAIGEINNSVNNVGKSMSGAGLGVAAGVATVAVTGIILTVNHLKKELDDLATDMNVFPEKITAFTNGIDTAKGVLAGFNIEQLITSERLSQIDSGIESAQQRIIEIAQNAAVKSREITDREYEEISRLIGMIDSYTSEKLDAYTQQQEVVNAMASREDAMNTETAQNYMKSAADAFSQAIAKAEEYRTSLYSTAQALKDTGKISDEKYTEMLNEADAYYKSAEDKANLHYSNTLSTITNAFYEQSLAQDEDVQNYIKYVSQYEAAQTEYNAILRRNVDGMQKASQADKDRFNELRCEMDETQKKITESLDGTAGDNLAAWVSMAGTTEMYGGQISEQSMVIVDTIAANYNSLPKRVKKAFSDAMEGALNGLKEKSATLYSKAGEIAGGVINKFKKIFDEHSPSRVTRKIFGYLLEGGELGLDDEKGNLLTKVSGISQEVIDRMTFNPNAFPKARNIGNLDAITDTANQILSSYSNSYTNSYDNHTETNDYGIHIGHIAVTSDSGPGSLESQLERIEYKRRQAERMKGKR